VWPRLVIPRRFDKQSSEESFRGPNPSRTRPVVLTFPCRRCLVYARVSKPTQVSKIDRTRVQRAPFTALPGQKVLPGFAVPASLLPQWYYLAACVTTDSPLALTQSGTHAPRSDHQISDHQISTKAQNALSHAPRLNHHIPTKAPLFVGAA